MSAHTAVRSRLAEYLPGIRAQLEDDLARLSGQVQNGEAERARYLADPDCDEDDSDEAARRWMAEQDASEESNRLRLLRQTALALHRLNDGSYGSCERCGEPIDPERLEAMPSATMCLPCRAASDPRR